MSVVEPPLDEQALFADGGPALTLVELDPGPLDDRLSRWRRSRPGWAVVRLRGERCVDAAGLFEEAAAALQLPSWFGYNWDAFADCLSDLGWLPATGYLLVVDEADQLLRDSPADLAVLVAVLTEAARTWGEAQPALSGGVAGPVPFATLLVCRPGTGTATARRLSL